MGGNVQYAGATSPSYADAIFKATIEGYERWQSGQVRADFEGAANQITEKWLDPRTFFPLTDEQAKKCGVQPFTDRLSISWTRGTDYDGSDILVPSDLVYYGQENSKNRIYFSNSSGVAAHFDFQEAKQRAITELIERDALMVNWFTRKPPYIVGSKLLPVHARKRINHWAEQNRRMMVLQIPSEFGLVFETIIVSDEYPCFISGAAAATDNKSINKAILKSLQEAEYSLVLALRYPDTSSIDPVCVLIPSDHGRVYHLKKNIEELRWLLEGDTIESFRMSTSGEAELKLVTVDLSDEYSEIRVVRVFSPYLVPINFGFNSAHYTHPALQGLGDIDPRSLKMPHYFA